MQHEGWIYCLETKTCSESGRPLVKLGQTRTNKTIEDYLINRYSGVYPDCKVILYKQVCAAGQAEKQLFTLLQPLHYKYELFIKEMPEIAQAFETVSHQYESINTRICKMSITQLNEINRKLREQLG